jgi:hypothetical protein
VLSVSLTDAAYLVLPFVVAFALGFGFVLVFRQRAAMRRAGAAGRLVEPDIAAPPRDPPPAGRPWWGNPWLWVGVCLAFVVLGVFVWPGLFGGTLLFLPFVWIRRPRSAPTMDPRANGHTTR